MTLEILIRLKFLDKRVNLNDLFNKEDLIIAEKIIDQNKTILPSILLTLIIDSTTHN